jgi:hypothetical protein
MRREAEAHPGPGARWLGDTAASGGYRMYGEGVLADLPFASGLTGPRRFLARARGDGAWGFESLDAAAGADGRLLYRSTRPGSLDYVLLVGGWRLPP